MFSLFLLTVVYAVGPLGIIAQDTSSSSVENSRVSAQDGNGTLISDAANFRDRFQCSSSRGAPVMDCYKALLNFPHRAAEGR